MRNIVTGISPRVRKSVDQPPPGKYSTFEGHQSVAPRHFAASSGVISQNGLSAGSPWRDCSPVQSSAAGPELIRWRKPPAARPVGSWPVTRLTAAGLQYVR